MCAAITSLENTLHSTQRRVTGQRQLLLEIIKAHGEHLDADELYRLARQRNPRLSLSTVYRTMNLLRDLNLVDELHLGEDHHHYEIKSTAVHHHLICLSCGQVVEFASPLTEELAAAVGREHNFRVEEVRIDLAGYCDRCRRTREMGAVPPISPSSTRE
jgi:Fe2+ or Zn2+ uptake regulation protein